LLLTGCRAVEEVATIPTEIEAIEIISLLQDFQIEARKAQIGEEGARQWAVHVPGADVSQAYRVLRDYGLPRPARAGRDKAQSGGLFPSPDETRQQQLNALESEIEKMLWMLPGVVRVKAIVSPAGGDILEFNPAQATASLVVVSRDKQPGFTQEQVRELVAGSVARLKPESVRVTIATELPRVTPGGVTAKAEDRFHQLIIGLIAALAVAICGLLGFALYRARAARRAALAAGETEGFEPGSELEMPGSLISRNGHAPTADPMSRQTEKSARGA
ncbi:MAG: hypothetical protein ACKV2V_13680, partial [Blastocatellia bacterium]